jgi:hypothetical protein
VGEAYGFPLSDHFVFVEFITLATLPSTPRAPRTNGQGPVSKSIGSSGEGQLYRRTWIVTGDDDCGAVVSMPPRAIDARQSRAVAGKKLPETLRARMVRFAELAEDAGAYCKGKSVPYGASSPSFDEVWEMSE